MSRGQAGDGEGTKTPGGSGDGGNRTKGGRGGQWLEGGTGAEEGLSLRRPEHECREKVRREGVDGGAVGQG